MGRFLARSAHSTADLARLATMRRHFTIEGNTMELDPIDTVGQAREARIIEQDKSRLHVLVAITVALLATFMGICKVKDDNIVQAMQQSQANKLDHWNFYQARNIREDVARAT